MKTINDALSGSKNWKNSVGISEEKNKFNFPYLGTPWEHKCNSLRSKKTTVSIVIPVWNSSNTISLCLSAIRNSSLNRCAPNRLEVIICDDGSSDGSWDNIGDSAFGMNVQAFRLPHLSQSSAINYAVQYASGEVVVFLDSDMILGCGALDELVARHELWDNVVCFGFRSDFDAVEEIQSQEDLWNLIHTEAFSSDNRVVFDLPSIEPNFLVASNWLEYLDAGKAIIDSQGMIWPRHRFLFGCLFSVRFSLLKDCDFFPDSLLGWGYNDTLVAARLEANGGFLLPVTSAWGHHCQHSIRNHDQWFQGSRNMLAYNYLLANNKYPEFWRRKKTIKHTENFREKYKLSRLEQSKIQTNLIDKTPVTLLRLGLWNECISSQNSYSGYSGLLPECLFRLKKYDEIINDDLMRKTIWGVMSLHRCNANKLARNVLTEISKKDSTCSYIASSSPPELLWLAQNFDYIGMFDTAQMYRDIVNIISINHL